MRSLRRGGNPGGYTLSEVLMAVVMIAILVALLVPLGNAARKASQNGRCVQQLRQIGAGLMSWVADHQGRLPPAAVIQANLYWFDLLNPYMGYPRYNESYRYPQPGARDSGFPLPWQQCPAQALRQPTREAVGYGWNYIHFGYTASRTSFNSHSRLAEVTHPSGTIIVGDSKDEAVHPGQDFEYRYLYSTEGALLPRRHEGKGNFLMLDGHVESFSPAALSTNRHLWTREKP